jgi:hypothetical protein
MLSTQLPSAIAASYNSAMLGRLRRWLHLEGAEQPSRAERRRRTRTSTKAAKRRHRSVTAGLAAAQGDWSTDDMGRGDVGSGGWDSGGGDGGGSGE